MGKTAIITGTGIPLDLGFRAEPFQVRTRYGAAAPLKLVLDDAEVVVLPRHGPNHVRLPHQINHRANIAALAKLGIQRILATNAVGSLRPDLLPGSLVLLSDFIDFTRSRPCTILAPRSSKDISRAHTDFSRPYCPELRSVLAAEAAATGLPLESTGTYICVSGPRFETPSEVRLFASWGADVVGMTGLPEAIFARECGICYAAVAVVANLGTGLSASPIRHDDVVRNVAASGRRLIQLFLHTIPKIPHVRSCGCSTPGASGDEDTPCSANGIESGC
ncbi:MAG: MTAP family purine nucleoside phosphorylase [Chthonomonadales bacterium]